MIIGDVCAEERRKIGRSALTESKPEFKRGRKEGIIYSRCIMLTRKTKRKTTFSLKFATSITSRGRGKSPHIPPSDQGTNPLFQPCSLGMNRQSPTGQGCLRTMTPSGPSSRETKKQFGPLEWKFNNESFVFEISKHEAYTFTSPKLDTNWILPYNLCFQSDIVGKRRGRELHRTGASRSSENVCCRFDWTKNYPLLEATLVIASAIEEEEKKS